GPRGGGRVPHPPSAGFSALTVAVALVTPRNGMVTLKGMPVSGLLVILPSNGGKPPELLTITTATAPACWPKMARAPRAHVPRCVTTPPPATFAATYWAGLQP